MRRPLDAANWSQADFVDRLASRDNISAEVLKRVFHLDHYEYRKAVDEVITMLLEHGMQADQRLPGPGESGYRIRTAVEAKMLRPPYSKKFDPPWLADPKKRERWYSPGMRLQDRQGIQEEEFAFRTVTQAFIRNAWRQARLNDQAKNATYAAALSMTNHIRSERLSPWKNTCSDISSTTDSTSHDDDEVEQRTNSPLADSRIGELMTHDAAPGIEPPTRIPLKEVMIQAIHVKFTRAGLKLESKLCSYASLSDEIDSKLFDQFSNRACLKSGEQVFYFRKSKVWKIKDGNDLHGAIDSLWTEMDTRTNDTDINIFISRDENAVRSIPDKYKRPMHDPEQVTVIPHEEETDEELPNKKRRRVVNVQQYDG